MHAFYETVTDKARKALESANFLAQQKQHPLVTNAHILWGLIDEENTAAKVLEAMKVDLKRLKYEIEQRLGVGTYKTHSQAVCYAPDAVRCICDAITVSQAGSKVIGCNVLLQSILMNRENLAAKILDKWNVTQELTEAYLTAMVKSVGPAER